MARVATWGFDEGDALAPQLTAIRLLGGGETCEAYLAYDEVTHGPVVVKVVRPDLTTDRASLQGFRREVDVLDCVNHPSVVRMLRAVVDSDRPLMVLEHVEGPLLSTLIELHGSLPAQQYLPLLVELRSALHHLVHLGLVHLDIKPANIIMGPSARLIDLSVARHVEAAKQLEVVVGTDVYMAPEQVDPTGAHRVGFPSDVWGIGVTLYEAVNGEPAFRAAEGAQGSAASPQLTAPMPRLPRQVPAGVAEVIAAALQHDPAQRPTLDQLGEMLEPLLVSHQPELSVKARV